MFLQLVNPFSGSMMCLELQIKRNTSIRHTPTAIINMDTAMLKTDSCIFLVLVLVCACVTHAFESCQTLNTEVVVKKAKTVEINGRRLHLLCAGAVPVKNCEGACRSQVAPSVVQFPGFKKVR